MTLRLPQADSLAGKCLALFQANPDLVYSAQEIAAEFEVKQNFVGNLLKPHVERGLMQKQKDGVKAFWGLGDGAAAAPAADGDTAQPDEVDGEPDPFLCAMYSDGDFALMNVGDDSDISVVLNKNQVRQMLDYLNCFDNASSLMVSA